MRPNGNWNRRRSVTIQCGLSRRQFRLQKKSSLTLHCRRQSRSSPCHCVPLEHIPSQLRSLTERTRILQLPVGFRCPVAPSDLLASFLRFLLGTPIRSRAVPVAAVFSLLDLMGRTRLCLAKLGGSINSACSASGCVDVNSLRPHECERGTHECVRHDPQG
jgi:hypothetical protein